MSKNLLRLCIGTRRQGLKLCLLLTTMRTNFLASFSARPRKTLQGSHIFWNIVYCVALDNIP
ncbi:hypothetical protein KC19_VG223000 [Ceratodon purpureus]|uniref:Uncharacterized protein n=1 Tax=Ceratodon purpureus TaxID=3225 RepID=A0A8T0HT10_CERPU|nr:hypothetical protein KC19_VG223000 [Ceratodon purpureus]